MSSERILPDVLPLSRPLIGVDLETTGVNNRRDRIVEIALEIMKPGAPVKEYRTLVNPGMPIPPGATKVHGITDEMVKDAPKFSDLAANLISGFRAADFVGYSVRFDLGFMAAEFKRTGHAWNYEECAILDPNKIWFAKENRTLASAVKRWLKRDPEASHSALDDIRNSTRVLAEMIVDWDLPADLRELHNLGAAGWYDAEGKFQWKEDRLEISFGEHRHKDIREIPRDYLSWIAGSKSDFSDKVKALCSAAMRGEFPTR